MFIFDLLGTEFCMHLLDHVYYAIQIFQICTIKKLIWLSVFLFSIQEKETSFHTYLPVAHSLNIWCSN